MPENDARTRQELCRTLIDFRQHLGDRVVIDGYWLPGNGDGFWIVSGACLVGMLEGHGSLTAEGYDQVALAALSVSEEPATVVSGLFEGKLTQSARGERVLIIERVSDVEIVPAPPALLAQFGDLMYPGAEGQF